MTKLINPLFMKKEEPFKVEASVSLASEENMERVMIKTIEGKLIPCMVDFENRVCLPIRKETI